MQACKYGVVSFNLLVECKSNKLNLFYRNMLLTEQSSWTRHMVSPRRFATDKTVNWGK